MGLLDKIARKTPEIVSDVANEIKPRFRFGGCERIGAYTKDADTRTVGELRATIDYFLKSNPDLQEFSKEINKMNPKHLNLVADTLEIGNRESMTMAPVTLKTINPNTGETWLKGLLKSYIKADKDNPDALAFAQEIINNTDSDAAKYTLASLTDAINHPETADLFKATLSHIKDLAAQAFEGGPTFDYSKERNFVKYLSAYIHPDSNPDKINLLKKVADFTEQLKQAWQIDVVPLIRGEAPVEKLERNFDTFKKVSKLTDDNGKTFEVSKFLDRNVNLT